MAGRGTNRGTHRAASSRWRFCARLNKFGIATSGSARASSSSAVRRPRRSPRPTSGDVTRRHAHRAQWELLGARATRLPPRSREVVPRGSIREAMHLSRRQHENAPRASTPERRALRCARRGQGAKLGLGRSGGDALRASQTVCPHRYPGHHLERTTPLHQQTVEKGARRESSSPSSFDGRRSRTCTACRRAAAWLRESSTPRPASGCERLLIARLSISTRAHEHNLARDGVTLRLEVRLQHASRVRRVRYILPRARRPLSHAFEVTSERVVRLRRAALRPPSAALVPPRLRRGDKGVAGRHLAEGVEESRGDARRRHLQKRRANLSEAGRATSQREWRRRSRVRALRRSKPRVGASSEMWVAKK